MKNLLFILAVAALLGAQASPAAAHRWDVHLPGRLLGRFVGNGYQDRGAGQQRRCFARGPSGLQQ